MQSDKEYILDSFKMNFEKYINEPVAIYGLGLNTGAVLERFPEYNIVGLMDETKVGEIVFGKKVLSLDEISTLDVKIIIIIARYANVPIIYRRIAHFCKENEISVFDINGTELSIESFKKNINLSEYDEINEEVLNEKINKNEIISFDVFDTLLMRDVLFPYDIFEILEKKMQEKYGVSELEKFMQFRINAERELYLFGNPSLSAIYSKVNEKLGLGEKIITEILNEEICIESEHILAREKMRLVFNETKKNKEVCIVSDMYLSANILREFLQENGFNMHNVDIYVSNEYNVSKENGLYNVIREKYAGKRILHIGDNKEADGISAKRYGIDDCFIIKSAYNMLEDSMISDILLYANQITDRAFLGSFIAYQFNDPFIFKKTNGKVRIESEYQMGFYFIAPIILTFIFWVSQKAREHKIDTFFLSARDGYILKRVLDSNENIKKHFPRYSYLYISRKVAVLASLRNEEDIKSAFSLAFSGRVDLLLKKRFGLTDNQIYPKEKNETDLEYVLRHKEAIIVSSENLRRKYRKYISKMVGKNDTKIGIFDFVSSGTCQKSLEKIIDAELVGFYFVRIYDDEKADLNIESLYPSDNIYKEQMAIMKKYFFLENTFTSFEPTLIDITEEGTPLFEKEKRRRDQLESLKKIQDGIVDCIMKFLGTEYKAIFSNLKFSDEFIRYISEEYALIETDYFKQNPLEDEFCNRSFNTIDFITS